MSIKDMIKKSVLESDMFNQTISTSTLLTIVVDLAVALLMGMLIYVIYKKFYQGVVFSRTFAMTLVGMCVLTCMVTLAISTNIVISLGMVGALSIVRYRTALKEPLDLLYLFWAITTGITIGASMYLLAICGTIVMIGLVSFFAVKIVNEKAFVMIVHSTGECEQEVQKIIKNMNASLKSRILRDNEEEITWQLSCKEKDTEFLDKIKTIDNVKDVTLVQYS